MGQLGCPAPPPSGPGNSALLAPPPQLFFIDRTSCEDQIRAGPETKAPLWTPTSSLGHLLGFWVRCEVPANQRRRWGP